VRKCPISVAIISGLYIVAGVVGLAYHATDLAHSPGYETFWVLLVRLLAVVGGVFALRGANWARWLLVAWISYHIGLSFYHGWSEVLVHTLFLGLTLFCLFNKRARNFFP
jgi:hypothetical protein